MNVFILSKGERGEGSQIYGVFTRLSPAKARAAQVRRGLSAVATIPRLEWIRNRDEPSWMAWEGNTIDYWLIQRETVVDG